MAHRSMQRLRAAGLVLAMGFALAACDTAEERAEKHYQNAIVLLEEGDVSRAIVELRSVFRLNGRHRDARALLAQTLLQEGRPRAAFSQYLRLIEQYPNDVEARLLLAEMSLLDDNWDLAEVHGDAVIELAPDSVRAQIIATALDYREAVLNENAPARREVAQEAERLAALQPDSVINSFIVIDSLMLDGENDAALMEVERMLETAPLERRFYQMKIALHGRADDDDGIEATLLRMVDTFPEDADIWRSLLDFYGSRGDIAGAENFLRNRIVPSQRDDTARVSLIDFLNQTQGPDAALEQASEFVGEGTNDDLFRSLEASLRYDLGQRAEALAALEDIVSNAEDSEQLREIQVAYARILDREGNEIAARALIEGVLEQDPTMVDALVMRAQWMLEADLMDDAILALRRAQDQEPENAQIYSTLATAYLLNGDRDLAGEMLALASDVSNRGPEESLRYGLFLIEDERFLPAEAILIEALRVSPDRVDLLRALGETYVRLKDWPRADQVERALRGLATEPGVLLADELRVTILRGQERDEDAIAFLKALSEQQGGLRAADIEIITTHMERGDVVAAQAYLDAVLETDPDDPTLKFLQAALNSAAGNLDDAEAQYRDLIRDGQGDERVWMELIRVLREAGKDAEAEAMLEEGLQAIPEGRDLLWMRASFLERRYDLEGAIAIYEDLYARNSSTSVIANNLASLLSTAREDAESLERAERIARRLRDSDFPPYQDTYGWIAYRRGNFDEAVEYLRPAAAGLPNDPLVQVHLGLAYAAVSRTADAIEQLELALEMAGDDPRDTFLQARTVLEELQNSDTGGSTTGAELDALPSAN